MRIRVQLWIRTLNPDRRISFLIFTSVLTCSWLVAFVRDDICPLQEVFIAWRVAKFAPGSYSCEGLSRSCA
jgi:hypothetical protein